MRRRDVLRVPLTMAVAQAALPLGAARATAPGQSGTPAARAQSGSVVDMRIANTDGYGARLRAEPSLTAELLAVSPDGAVALALGPERVASEESWRRLRALDGAEGWIASAFLVTATEPE